MNTKFNVLRVGEVDPRLAIHADGCMFSWANIVPAIYVFINRPNEQIQAAADISAHGLRVGAYTYGNVLTLAVKPGLLPWHDAPYNPHCEEQGGYLTVDQCAEGEGVSAIYVLVDSADGRILQMCPFVFSSKFSNHLLKENQLLLRKDFDIEDYYATIAKIQRRFTARDIGEKEKQAYFRLSGSAKE